MKWTTEEAVIMKTAERERERVSACQRESGAGVEWREEAAGEDENEDEDGVLHATQQRRV